MKAISIYDSVTENEIFRSIDQRFFMKCRNYNPHTVGIGTEVEQILHKTKSIFALLKDGEVSDSTGIISHQSNYKIILDQLNYFTDYSVEVNLFREMAKECGLHFQDGFERFTDDFEKCLQKKLRTTYADRTKGQIHDKFMKKYLGCVSYITDIVNRTGGVSIHPIKFVPYGNIDCTSFVKMVDTLLGKTPEFGSIRILRHGEYSHEVLVFLIDNGDQYNFQQKTHNLAINWDCISQKHGFISPPDDCKDLIQMPIVHNQPANAEYLFKKLAIICKTLEYFRMRDTEFKGELVRVGKLPKFYSYGTNYQQGRFGFNTQQSEVCRLV